MQPDCYCFVRPLIKEAGCGAWLQSSSPAGLVGLSRRPLFGLLMNGDLGSAVCRACTPVKPEGAPCEYICPWSVEKGCVAKFGWSFPVWRQWFWLLYEKKRTLLEA